jgi:hypothetical protein
VPKKRDRSLERFVWNTGDVELERGDERVALATVEVPVISYPRRTKHGVSRVRAHTREMEVDITPAPDPFAGHFDIPMYPKDAATKDADARIAEMSAELRRLEAMPLADRWTQQGEMAVALLEEWFVTTRRTGRINEDLSEERRPVEGEEREKILGYFKADNPHLERRLALARGDRRARAALIRRLTTDWKNARVDMVQPDQAELMERESREAFTEPKMAAAAKVFGMPDLFAAYDLYGPRRKSENRATPLAQFTPPSLIVTYDRTAAGRKDVPGPLGSDPFVAGADAEPDPGQLLVGGGTEIPKSFKGVLRHEYGHMVGRKLSDGPSSYPDGFGQIYRRYVDERERQIRDGEELPFLSYYSLSGANEGWAEAFAIVMHPDFERTDWDGVLGEELLDTVIAHLIAKGVWKR